ncbi:peptidyl-glycine alpha-amidating monooxygenase A [Aplysia californica]|uniref:Peptidyl-glycine alpha-amidating monooxygenase A n=1 Tax=Aplysia californica TaxID=6500 RepID=A0ABM1W3M2_APLCA|nr:peptidyl-glycine alpha-amidating monooxygenase A [Aplysia californica]
MYVCMYVYVPEIHFDHPLQLNTSWPGVELTVGQVGGVSVDQRGNLYVFHRGSRVWNAACVICRVSVPSVVSVCHLLCQCVICCVFKIPAGSDTPTLTIGHRFQHGEELTFFCKPTDVAVLSSGEFFVSDGVSAVCLSLLTCVSAEVSVSVDLCVCRCVCAGVSPPPGTFDVPHSVTVSEGTGQLCVADRENGRVQCFDLEGNFDHLIRHKEFGPRLFAVEVCPLRGVLYAVNGPAYDGPSDLTVQGFTVDMSSGQLLESWNIPQGLRNPHDLAVDPTTCGSVYVGELNPRVVWKLTRADRSTTPTPHLHMDTQIGRSCLCVVSVCLVSLCLV